MKHLWYLSTNAFPSAKAHCVQIAKMCEAFQEQGYETTLIHPQYLGRRYPAQALEAFNIQHAFRHKAFKVLSFFELWWGQKSWAAYLLWLQCYVILFGALLGGNRSTVVFSRELLICVMARLLGYRQVVWEVHLPSRFHFKFWVKMPHLIVAITPQLQREILKIAPGVRVLYLEDGFSTHDFKVPAGQPAIWNTPKFTIGYFGKTRPMGIDKGISFFLETLKNQREHFYPVLVGVEPERLEGLRQTLQRDFASDFHLEGHIPFRESIQKLQQCQMVILPYPRHRYLNEYTSPLKLFEAMAAGKLVICSNLPSLTQIIRDGANGLVYEPEDAGSLQAVLQRIVEQPGLIARLGSQAQKDVQVYAYHRRVETILNALK